METSLVYWEVKEHFIVKTIWTTNMFITILKLLTLSFEIYSFVFKALYINIYSKHVYYK